MINVLNHEKQRFLIILFIIAITAQIIFQYLILSFDLIVDLVNRQFANEKQYLIFIKRKCDNITLVNNRS